jgi:hypothetical protein
MTQATENIRHPRVCVKLVGADGNAYNILGLTIRAMKRANVPPEEIARYQAEATSGDYDHLLQTTLRYVDCE